MLDGYNNAYTIIARNNFISWILEFSSSTTTSSPILWHCVIWANYVIIRDRGGRKGKSSTYSLTGATRVKQANRQTDRQLDKWRNLLPKPPTTTHIQAAEGCSFHAKPSGKEEKQSFVIILSFNFRTSNTAFSTVFSLTSPSHTCSM